MFGARNGQYLGTQFPFFGSQTVTKGSNVAPVFPTPVEWWKTNEGSGTTLATQSGSGDTLTFNGTWTNPGGFPFVVPTFNGSTQSATGANATNTSFNGTTPFSVSAWVNSSNLAAFQVIIGNITGGGATGWEFALNIQSPGNLNVTISSTYPTSAIAVHSSVGLSANALHHVAFTYDGSQAAANVKMYLDGVLLTTVIDTNTLSTAIVSANPVVAGQRSGNFFTGAIADMRIYSAVLSAAQISTLFAGGVV